MSALHPPGGIRLWLRWSWRDLRARGVLVVAIAMVIALGVGAYAALASTSAWRRTSNAASFAAGDLHDVRVRLATGTTAPEGALAGLVRGVPGVRDVRERLVVPTRVSVGDVLVTGELVGMAPGSTIDRVVVQSGRDLTVGEQRAPVVIIERAFAKARHLAESGTLRVTGGTPARWVGQGQAPEYYMITGAAGGAAFMSQSSYAVLFCGLPTAQRLVQAAGRVNDVAVTLVPGTDPRSVAAQVRTALAMTSSPAIAAEVTTREELDSYRILTKDVDGDQQMFTVIALLVLGGAAFATVTLTTRVVAAQRRQIGVGMALGVSRGWLAVRPLLFGTQVAVLGVLLGIGVGLALGEVLRAMFVDVLPLPVWRTPFQLGAFAQAAVLGLGVPVVACAWPVWRAVRVQPVEAIRVTHLSGGRGGRLTARLGTVRLPGRSYRHVPARNILRTPRRAVLTALGIAAALTAFVSVMGMLDSFNVAIGRSERELSGRAADRVTVQLDTFLPPQQAAALTDRVAPGGHVDPGVLLPATATGRRGSLDLLLETMPADPIWRPTLTRGTANGLVLAAKAADDLGLRVGDAVRLRYPRPEPGGFRNVEVAVPVAGLHANPTRVYAYASPVTAAALGLDAVANALTVRAAPGVGVAELRRALFTAPHVASAEPPATTTRGMREGISQITGILQIAGAVTLLLALLIAVNATTIGVDERAREHATMLAFGLPRSTVLGLAATETVLLGVAGTVAGLAAGFAVLQWIVRVLVPDVLPEMAVTAALSAGTVAAAVLLGMVAVMVAPLFSVRRLRRMDIPATLRVME